MTDIKQQESQVGRFTGDVNQMDVGSHNRVDIIDIIGNKIKTLKEKVSIVHEGGRVDIVMCLYHGVGREDGVYLALLRRAEELAVTRRRTETAWQ
jgi:hypothetical protein